VRAEVCPSCGQAAPAGGFHALPLGFKSRYRLIDQLGRGGQGAVFLAHDEASPDEQGKPLEVALKVARLDLAIDLRHRLLERFRREMSATMRLSTEVRGEENRRHFVRCLASDLGRSPYLVLELVTWPTLRQLLERSPGERFGSYDEVVDFGIELLLGVATMHEHRMVHRDLKPENLFVRLEQGRFSIKIADFGVWTDPPVQEGGHGGSLTHDLVGTPEYMSPEQQMSGAVGARSDLHAVGSILWLTATGVKPFGWDRSAPSFQDAFLRRVEALKVPPPRPAEMPEDLYAALVHALAYDVEQRYTDARAFVRALRELKRSWNNSKVEAFRVLRDELDALAEQIDHAATRVRAVTETGEALAVLARDVAEARIQSAATSMEFPQLRERVESLRVDAARLTRALDGLFQAESNATARTLAAGSDSLPEKPSATPTPPPVQTLTPETPPPRSGARVTLLGVGSGAVTAGGLFLLLRLYGTPAAAPTAPPEPHVAPPPAARTEPATPSLDDPALNPWQPVPEQPFVMHQHEVTRAEYARWLDTPEQHARRVPWIIGDAETRPHPSVLTSLAADERLLPVVDIDHE
jgi:serine/threonine protein kinase